MKSSIIESLNPYVTDTSLRQKYVTVKQYNELKDDFDAMRSSDTTASADTLTEVTAAAGVTIDSALFKDNTLISKLSVSEAVTTTLTAAMSGKVFYINASTVGAIYTLPAPIAGLNYKWIWTADNNNEMKFVTADLTNTSGDMFAGGLLSSNAAAANTFVEASVTGNKNTLVIDNNDAGNYGGIGSWVEITCTEDPSWFITGILNANGEGAGAGAGLFTNAD
jgi:hypothetical protein